MKESWDSENKTRTTLAGPERFFRHFCFPKRTLHWRTSNKLAGGTASWRRKDLKNVDATPPSHSPLKQRDQPPPKATAWRARALRLRFRTLEFPWHLRVVAVKPLPDVGKSSRSTRGQKALQTLEKTNDIKSHICDILTREEKKLYRRKKVREFIDLQPDEVQAEYLKIVEQLEKDGRLVEPFGKKLDTDLFEIRVRRGKQVRVLYFYFTNDLVIGVHGFVKKSQKTPPNEIKQARRVMTQVQRGEYEE